MNTDLELYRIFCIVVEYQSISKAARSMYISQSAITQSIQKLEGYLGGKVFYRSNSGVELTEQGKTLYEYVKESVDTINNAEKIFSKYSKLEKGKIRICVESDLLINSVLEPVLNFMKKYPKINISIKNDDRDYMMKELTKGEVDIVVLDLPYTNKGYANIEIIPLEKSNYCFFASKEYLINNPINDENEIKSRTIILPQLSNVKKQMLLECFDEDKNFLNNNYEVESPAIMKELVLKNIGIGYINKNYLNDINDQIEIIKETEPVEIGIATLKKDIVSTATAELIKEIKKE